MALTKPLKYKEYKLYLRISFFPQKRDETRAVDRRAGIQDSLLEFVTHTPPLPPTEPPSLLRRLVDGLTTTREILVLISTLSNVSPPKKQTNTSPLIKISRSDTLLSPPFDRLIIYTTLVAALPRNLLFQNSCVKGLATSSTSVLSRTSGMIFSRAFHIPSARFFFSA